MEVDSFGLFVNKAKTRVYRYTTEPKWNEVKKKKRPALTVHKPCVLYNLSLVCVRNKTSRGRSVVGK